MKIIIAAGGTGGHIFPGLAVARAFRKRDPSVEILFVGSKKGIEAKLVMKEGYQFREIAVKGLKGGRIAAKSKSILLLLAAFFQSAKIISSFKPDMVLGLGGYASGPIALGAKLMGAKLIIHEQNSIPGLTNKILARVADGVAVSFEKTLRYFQPGKSILTGNPVREEIALMGGAGRDGIRGAGMTVLVFGGSQGASSINRAIIEGLDFLLDIKEKVRFVHQTGRGQEALVSAEYQKRGYDALVLPFIEDMARSYSQADLVVCRSGATTVAELAATGRPAILIPYPYAANNHQLENAMALAGAGAAVVIEESHLSGQGLAQKMKSLLSEPEELRAMGIKAKSLAVGDAAEKLADFCCELVPGARVSR